MKPTDAHGHGAGDHNPDTDHEHSDINIRAVLAFAGGLTVVTIAVFVVIVFVFNGLERMAASNDPRLSPLATPGGQEPPEPRLLTNEPASLAKVRGAEHKILEGYGWVDQAKGVAYISIEDAKNKLVKDGLPTRAAGSSPIDERLGTWAPALGESSSGRVLGSRAKAGEAKPATPAAAPAPEHKGH